MSTLKDLRAAADHGAIFETLTDATTPEGTFVVVTKVVGIASAYLLTGTKDDERAQVMGRVEMDNGISTAYQGHGPRGGRMLSQWRGDEQDLRVIFADMID